MLNSFSERRAAKKDPRFRAFVEGKQAYEAYLQSSRVPFHAMSEDQHRQARDDSNLSTAKERFAAAISMSEREGVLADAAVAKCQLAMTHHARGELDEARALMRAALGVMTNLPNQDRSANISLCHYHLGVIAMKQNRFLEAVRDLRRARELDEARADLAGVHICEQALSACAKAGANIEHPAPEPPETVINEEPSKQADEVFSEEPSPPKPEQESGPVRYKRREVIFLVSHSVEANDALMVHLNTLGKEFGRPVSISRAASDAPDPKQRRLQQPPPDQHACAAILILEKAGVQHPAFRKWANILIQRAATSADFRLLVYLHDLTMEELREWSDREPMIAKLFDTTQIAESPSLEQLRRTLVPYVRRVERIQAEARWRKFRIRTAAPCGRLASVLLVTAAVMALLGYPLWRMLTPQNGLGPYAPAIASFLLGVLAFPLQAPLIFLLLRGMRFTVLAPRDNAVLMRWIGVGFVVMMGATLLHQTLDGPPAWLLLGLAAGVLLDSVRRAGQQARRQGVNLEALLKHSADSTWRAPENSVRQGDPLKPFSCPLLPSLSPRIFISYTRSSTKGIQLATSLYRKLKAHGAAPFLDRASIPEGANWRQVLNRQLGECDVFICILDERSVQREWVAAEVLAAIEARRITGGPEIVLLMDPAIRKGARPMLPLFQGIMAAADDPPIPGRPRIVMLNADTPATLAWGFAPEQFTSRTVFPRGALLPVKYPMIGLGILGGFGTLAGFVLGFLALLEMMAGFQFSAGLMDRGWLVPVALLSFFWLGYTARATVVWKFEVDHSQETGSAIPTLATTGLAMAAITLAPHLSGLATGWAAVLLVAGWMLVASVIRMGPAKHGIEKG